MIRDGDAAIRNWLTTGHGETPPPHIAAAFRARDRLDQVEKMEHFAEPYIREDGSTGNVADLIPALYESNKQFELKLGAMSRRALVRLELAHAIQAKVLPICADPWIRKLPERLRQARQSFCLGFRPSDGRRRVMWDMKAGLSRICPDDAREDAMRLQRRVIDPLLELKKNGCQVTYAVLTMPNYQPGNLRLGIRSIFRRFNALLKKRRNGQLLFDNVVGAMAVLEAPLARDRTWNVHLNVLLVHRGFLDWKAMRDSWHYNAHFERIRGGRDDLERAMREIIKYSARAVAEKSEIAGCPAPRPASGGPEPAVDIDSRQEGASRSGPPAMCDWTGEELLEWLTAFRGFRRTRTYKKLYRLPKPERDSLTGYLWVGQGELIESSYRVRVGPLDSIPGDKSTTPDALERWLKFLSRLKPHPPPAGKCERFA